LKTISNLKKKVETMPKVTAKAKNRKVVHKDHTVALHTGKNALTENEAKQLLGWVEEPDDNDFKDDFDLKHNGTKVRLTNNLNNRPIANGWVKTLSQELLRGRWQFNFENLIIGRTGLVLSGQHRLLAFIQACEDYRNDPDSYSLLKKAPTIEVAIAYGLVETDEVVNTIDTGKPRTLSDVLFRSELFKKINKSERKEYARNLDYAVKTVWQRTGVDDAFGIKRTHAESLDFIHRHPKLVEAVAHVTIENDDGSLSKLIPAGTCAGAMYLMSCSGSDPTKYTETEEPSEKELDFGLWEMAEKFWTLLSSSDEMKSVRNALSALLEADEKASNEERIAIIIKAWKRFVKDQKIMAANLKLKYRTHEDGYKELAESPTVGGIDFGGDRELFGAEQEDEPEVEEPVEEPVEASAE